MSPVLPLLRRTLARCNERGKTIAAVVATLGALTAIIQISAPPVLLHHVSFALPSLLGTAPADEFTQRLYGARVGTDDYFSLANDITTAIENASESVPDEQRPAFFAKAAPRLVNVAGWLLLFLAVVAVLEIFARALAYFAAAREPDADILIPAVAQAPRLLAVWIVTAIVTGAWISVLLIALGFFAPSFLLLITIPALLLPLLLYPRFMLAPAILLREKTGILAAVRKSFERTKGRYGQMFSAFVGVQVTVFLGQRIAELFIGGIMALAAGRSPYAPLIGMIVFPFIHIVMIAYKCAFVVEVNEDSLTP